MNHQKLLRISSNEIIVLMGNPNLNGSTSILTDSFIEGTKEAEHSVERINLDSLDVNSCTGCVNCSYEGPRILKNDNKQVRDAILGADILVFATPLYYYVMSAQLKIVIDRFCVYNSSINRKHLKSALLTVTWNLSDWTFDTFATRFQTLIR